MNFVLLEMTYLRYFIPLIIEANKMGIRSNIYVGWRFFEKYNSPYKYENYLKKISEIYDFELLDIEQWNNQDGITFFIEGVGLHNGPCIKKESSNQTFICITSMADYQSLYNRYIDICDYVIFPNKFFAEEFGTLSEKNLYFGSPKYDIKLKDAGGRDKLRALIIHPHPIHPSENLQDVHSILRDCGFEIFVKTRGKHPVEDKNFRGDKYFVDDSWFPHTTMTLISQSDLIINFDSSTIKESIMLEKPMLNFNSLGDRRVYKFLYNHDFCVDLNVNEKSEQKILEGIWNLVENNFSESYSYVKDKYLWKHNASKKILDYFLET